MLVVDQRIDVLFLPIYSDHSILPKSGEQFASEDLPEKMWFIMRGGL